MKKSEEPIGTNIFSRYLHLHSLKYTFKLASLDSSAKPEGTFDATKISISPSPTSSYSGPSPTTTRGTPTATNYSRTSCWLSAGRFRWASSLQSSMPPSTSCSPKLSRSLFRPCRRVNTLVSPARSHRNSYCCRCSRSSSACI